MIHAIQLLKHLSLCEDFKKVHTGDERMRKSTRSAGKKAITSHGSETLVTFYCAQEHCCEGSVSILASVSRKKLGTVSLSTKACPVVYWN